VHVDGSFDVMVNAGLVRDGLLTGQELEVLRSTELTYPEVGRSDESLPAGYHHLRRQVGIGSGVSRFEQAADLLLSWGMHRRAGVEVRPSSTTVTDDAVAILRLGRGIAAVDAPVRVVHLLDEPHRKGFAYGTLAGHPESGEEAFVVEIGDDGAVRFTITAFSRPARLFTRIAGPANRAVQSIVTKRYLRSMQELSARRS
jgi:uncharacterized protein (UPF0548 family)